MIKTLSAFLAETSFKFLALFTLFALDLINEFEGIEKLVPSFIKIIVHRRITLTIIEKLLIPKEISSRTNS